MPFLQSAELIHQVTAILETGINDNLFLMKCLRKASQVSEWQSQDMKPGL